MIIINSRFALFRASKSYTSFSYKSCNLELPIGVEPSPIKRVSFRDAWNSVKEKISSFLTSEVDSSFFLFLGLLKMPKVSKKNPSRVYSYSLRVLTSTFCVSGMLGMISCSSGFFAYVACYSLLWSFIPLTLSFSLLGSYFSSLISLSPKMMGVLLVMHFLFLLLCSISLTFFGILPF